MNNTTTRFGKEFILPVLVSIVIFMEFLDITIINTAIPSIARSFNVNPILLKFSVTSYFLSLAIFIPISGWCTDKFGTRPVFLSSVFLFVVASFLCAISQNIFQLTMFRFLQGIGGAFMNPVSRIIIVRLFPPKDLVRIQAIIFTPAMLGQVLGPFLGGLITSYLSWHWIFYINIPIGLFAIYIGNSYIEQQTYPTNRFDSIGFILVAMSLSCLTFFIEMLNHYEIASQTTVFLTGGIGVILFLILIIHCLKTKNPIFDFAIFKIKTFRVGFSVNVSAYMTNASIAFLLPLMYQEVFHLSPAKSGTLILPIAFGYLICRSFASKIIPKLGFRRSICIASMLVGIAVILIGHIESTTSIYFLIFAEFLFGASWMIIGASTGALNYTDMPIDKTSMATSIDITFRQFFASFGIGFSAFILTSLAMGLSIDVFSSTKIFHYTFYIIAALALINVINGLRLNNEDGTHVLNKNNPK
jgi:EmrB/QacA subfamily drug resistance transporter